MIILNPMLDFLKESAKEGNEKRLEELKKSLVVICQDNNN